MHPGTIESMLELAAGTPPGCFIEVGVYQGGSAWHLSELAQRQGRALFLFDTFGGLPYCDRDKGDDLPIGEFADTSLEAVRTAIPTAIVVPGVFPQSLIDAPELPPIAFAHIDVDQYRSVYEAIEAIKLRIVQGGVMLFDDYNQLAGATLAVDRSFPLSQIQPTRQGRAFVRF